MINANSLAAANAVGVQNKQFQPGAQVLERKIVLIGTYDASKSGIADNIPERFLSVGAVAEKYGFGSMIHRLAIKSFLGSQGLETWVIPQPEAGGAAASVGKMDITGPATEDGLVSVYISGEFVSEVAISNGDIADDIAAAIIASIPGVTGDNAATALVNGVNSNEVDYTAKSKGPWGNDIDLSINLDDGEDLPAGVAIAITPMAGGTTNPDIQEALDGMGVDDNQNEKFFTGLVHGYGQDLTVLDAVSIYNGIGNDFTGNYSQLVARPFRSLNGDVEPGDAALLALIVITDARLEDRTNGIIAAPGSQNHPAEIASLAMGIMELVNNTRAEETYIDRSLPGIRLGDNADRWTDKYDNRDTAVKSGISPTLVKNNVLTIQNVVSFYRPVAVPTESNGYRSMRNISILQNLLSSQRQAFEADKWKGITIVADLTKVSNPTSRLKARDVSAVLDELVSLALLYEGLAWLFSASFTLDELKKGDKVVLRPAGNGFDIVFPVILSGEGGILNQVIEFDTSLAVFL